MTREELVAYCLAKPGAYRDSPWGEDHDVAKVGGKIFCFFSKQAAPPGVTVKATAERTAEWRDRFPEHVGPAPYLPKHLWNAVALHGLGAPDGEDARELIDDSYDLVVATLPRSKRPS